MAHRNEFELTRCLDHENIVSSIDIFENCFTGEIHQIMPLVRGKELVEIIADMGRIDEGLAKKITEQLLSAI